ncbi:hypothetical protein I3842_08G107100 [Carya illinoinensis]|uniref:Secreted protein n=1 Tax=Carya illinoinensis TaxID=32201 RepID=A0A922EB58_CARIL|nr:hypothetical protein I3842_08G107100 [Carya illinoinensis]
MVFLKVFLFTVLSATIITSRQKWFCFPSFALVDGGSTTPSLSFSVRHNLSHCFVNSSSIVISSDQPRNQPKRPTIVREKPHQGGRV